MAISIDKQGLKKFIAKWTGKGKEDEDDRSYWVDLFQDVFVQKGVTDRLRFQYKVAGRDGNTKRIDIYIPETHVLIEQKSLGIPLDKPQYGHSGMTPYEQARMYNDLLPYNEKVHWIVTCNFAEIWIYDMNKRNPEEDIVKISLKNLEKDYVILQFLFDAKLEQIRREFTISKEAGDLIGEIYKSLLALYPGEPTKEEYEGLNLFCVRIVFCYYAEDAELFGKYQFRDYIDSFHTEHLRNGLKDLFRILNTKEAVRDRNDSSRLLGFPYVNGGLFDDDGKTVIFPRIDERTHKLLIAASDFNWAEISPTIFGAIFESTLNKETRRKGGMHYTSVENIHKVIDPLFLDDLKSEYKTICELKQANKKREKLIEYQKKLASLKFLDPACGSGNFLTETYLSLRRIENEVIKTLIELDPNKKVNANQIALLQTSANDRIVKVDISQFYGIEINDFAVAVAKTALWIAESQMLSETEAIIYHGLEFLPLKSYINIIQENALTYNWNRLISSSECSYIMGNPPFIGARKQTEKQKADVHYTFGKSWKGVGDLDYVCCWYKKAVDYIKGTSIHCALVSTNSITQGGSVAILWKPLFQENVNIEFAHRTFRWDSEASIKARVHCVIIGFSTTEYTKDKIIYDGNHRLLAKNINGYLVDYDNICVESRNRPVCDVPTIGMGNQPIDGGNYLFDEEEKRQFVKEEPKSEKWFMPWYGAQEFISQKPRYCLWLGHCSPKELREMPKCLERVDNVNKLRLKSERASTRKLADRPTRFQTENMPVGHYICIPEVSSENRKYVPMGYMDDTVLCSNKLRLMPDASLYHFGILQSSVHMAWVNAVCGRLETRIDYSINIVYNNFPWPKVDSKAKDLIAKSAQKILDSRDLYKEDTLEDMYGDEMYLYPELVSAHEENNKEVMKAYGFSTDMTEAEIVAALMEMYVQLNKV